MAALVQGHPCLRAGGGHRTLVQQVHGRALHDGACRRGDLDLLRRHVPRRRKGTQRLGGALVHLLPEGVGILRILIIGLFQVLSLVPGTSRSGATILGGILFGTSRYVAAEFTFFLAIPVMFGASLLKMVKFGWHYTGSEILILVVGMATAFVVSILSIKFLLRYIKNNDFKAFGWYRIVLGIIVVLYLYFVGDPVQG